MHQTSEHRVTGDVIKRPNSVDGQHRRPWVHFGGNTQETDECLCACPGAEAILKWHAGGLELGRVLLCKGASDEAAQHISDYEGPCTPVRLAESDYTASSNGREDGRRHVCTCKSLGSTVQERAVRFLV